MSKILHAVIISSVITFTVLAAYALCVGGLGYELPPIEPRTLAKIYLSTTFNPSLRILSAMAPEAVTAIVWDYRGLDTVFETTVLYLAIIASIAIMRGIEHHEPYDEKKGMSIIGKTATKIIVPFIIGVAGAIALHGHLTPGGGFQGGATAAVAPLLVLVIFSVYFLEGIGLTKNRALVLRSAGLLGLGITSFIVFIIALIKGFNAFILQNQPKPYSPIGLPYAFNGNIIGGTLLLFNISEMLAVAAGFTILFILLAIPEEKVKKVISSQGESHG